MMMMMMMIQQFLYIAQ